MRKSILWLLLVSIMFSGVISAQKIAYSDPDKEDPRTLQFELIGKINGRNLIYKGYREQHFICA